MSICSNLIYFISTLSLYGAELFDELKNDLIDAPKDFPLFYYFLFIDEEDIFLFFLLLLSIDEFAP